MRLLLMRYIIFSRWMFHEVIIQFSGMNHLDDMSRTNFISHLKSTSCLFELILSVNVYIHINVSFKKITHRSFTNLCENLVWKNANRLCCWTWQSFRKPSNIIFCWVVLSQNGSSSVMICLQAHTIEAQKKKLHFG